MARAWSRSAGRIQSLIAFMFLPHTHLARRPGPFPLSSENTPLTSLRKDLVRGNESTQKNEFAQRTQPLGEEKKCTYESEGCLAFLCPLPAKQLSSQIPGFNGAVPAEPMAYFGLTCRMAMPPTPPPPGVSANHLPFLRVIPPPLPR